MRVYLDNCCLNRPFDDQEQMRIRIESEAKLYIQDGIRAGTIELAWSYVVDYENSVNPFEERKQTIAQWKLHACTDTSETPETLAQATALHALGLKPKDALHIACAVTAGCDYFVTTDDGILRRRDDISAVRITDPPGLIRELGL